MSKTFRSEKKFRDSLLRRMSPRTHIAGPFTIGGKEFLTVHAKWIGRCDQRGAKLQHGSALSTWSMRALRRLDGAGDAV